MYSAMKSDTDNKMEGRADTQHFFNAAPEVEDSSGDSESSEGIVDHGAFNRRVDIKKKDVSKEQLEKLIEDKVGPDNRASLDKAGRNMTN